MAAASLSITKLNYFNDARFSVIIRVKYILKQCADINRVLNEMKKVMNLKKSLKNTCRAILIPPPITIETPFSLALYVKRFIYILCYLLISQNVDL